MLITLRRLLHPSPYFWLWLAVASALLLPALFTRGLFLDGITYAAISRNLSVGTGSLWSPFYTLREAQGFVDQPPLYFWLEGGWFWLIGDHFFTERLFSILCYLACIVLIYNIFRQKSSDGWLSLLMWTTALIVPWSFSNNMLENLIAVFVLSAWLTLRKRYTNNAGMADLLWVSMLFVATFLTKGPVALGILALPLTFLISGVRIRRVFVDTAVLVIIGGAAVAALFTVLPTSQQLQYWFDAQIVGVLSGKRSVEFNAYRWISLWYVFQQMLIPIGLAFSAALLTRKRPAFHLKDSPWLLAGMLFSLPFLISGKQHEYYLVPSLFFYGAYLLLVFQPAFDAVMTWFEQQAYLQLRAIGAAVFAMSLILSLWRFGDFSRHEDMIRDLYLMQPVIKDEEKVGLDRSLYENWGLLAYGMRNIHVSLVANQQEPYLISKTALAGWRRVPLETRVFHLYEKQPVKEIHSPPVPQRRIRF